MHAVSVCSCVCGDGLNAHNNGSSPTWHQRWFVRCVCVSVCVVDAAGCGGAVESKKALLQRVELLQRQLQSREGEVAALQGELQTLRSRPSSPAATASAASGSPRPP